MDNTIHYGSSADLSTRPVPFNQAYWVVPGRLMAGCYPGSENPVEADFQLAALLDHGIRQIINLMQPGEINRVGKPFVPYRKRLIEIAAAKGCGVNVERHAINIP